MSKVALIIIYNHQYNENIDVLENIYNHRFSDIYHLVPFYSGKKENVIPVYESSWYFQGYAAQGFHSYFKEKYSHYFFIADDLMLNPKINENNYSDIFNLDKETSFIPFFITLHERKIYWLWVKDAYFWGKKESGVEMGKCLPDYDTAKNIFFKFGLTIEPLRFGQIWDTKQSWIKFLCSRDFFKRFNFFCRYLLDDRIRQKLYNLSYPFVGGYSDIFIVSAKSIREFCHYCGVFAATKLFVEVALPTSMVLSAYKIVTEKDLSLQGKSLWSKEEYKEVERYNNSLTALMNDFPPGYLYLHPIKLSKWKIG